MDARDHVVNQAMLIAQPLGFKGGLELSIVNFLKQVLEPAVVGLQNRVLGGKVDRIRAIQQLFQYAVRSISSNATEPLRRS